VTGLRCRKSEVFVNPYLMDVDIFESCFGKSAVGQCADADGNSDGVIDIQDQNLIFSDGFESGDTSS